MCGHAPGDTLRVIGATGGCWGVWKATGGTGWLSFGGISLKPSSCIRPERHSSPLTQPFLNFGPWRGVGERPKGSACHGDGVPASGANVLAVDASVGSLGVSPISETCWNHQSAFTRLREQVPVSSLSIKSPSATAVGCHEVFNAHLFCCIIFFKLVY